MSEKCEKTIKLQVKKKYGRPKLQEEDRRSIARKISYSPIEDEIILLKSTDAGTTPAEWIRAASLETKPKTKRVIPKLNQRGLLELSNFTELLNQSLWRFSPGDEPKLFEEIYELKLKVGELQKSLLGENV